MKRLLLFILLALPASAQLNSNTLTIRFAGAPSGPCSAFMLGINNATSALYNCKTDHTWNVIGGGGGAGTVTSVGFAAPTGFNVTNSPVTGAGTLTLAMPTSWTTGDLLLGDGANSV